MTDCIFCKIASGIIPVKAIYEDEHSLIFSDQEPQAPTHLLAIPRRHFANAAETPADLLGHLLHVAATVARQRLPEGYRIVINTGDGGGQTVCHLHLHLIGGRPLHWPPG